jgi:hypothetical protein
MPEKEEYYRILIKKGKSWTRKVLQSIIQERKKQYSKIIIPENLVFLMSVQTTRSCVRTQLAESLCSQNVRTARRTQVTVRSCSLACSDTRWHVRTLLPRNSLLTCFRVSRAYLKGVLGNVSLRILVDNFILLRENLLGINVYMYLF